MPEVRVFLSFDLENDEDLRELIFEHSSRASSGFEISDQSEAGAMNDGWNAMVRRRICDADEVVVICGKHTDMSPRIEAELRIAQEAQKPYLLLWGRRETMCTRPAGARPADSMYSWTWEILRNQIIMTLRNARRTEIREAPKRA